MSQEAAVVWHCDFKGCREWSYANEDVSPVAFGWTSLELSRTARPTVTIEFCKDHAKEPDALAILLDLLREKAKP
jgi:hypothetical protein